MIDTNGALLTDLYQLTMLEAYFRQGMADEAVFECYVRKLPEQRAFLVAAGLEQLLDYLESLHFTSDELSWLSKTNRFGSDFVRWLANFRFEGDVYALPEGTVCYANEPLVRIVAPLPQAQFIESRLINLLHFQTMIASKAARCVLAAPGRMLLDFGFRRAHGSEAGVLAARANYLVGFEGTATVAAGALYGIPVFGTMAHSFVQAHDNEVDAFRHFAHTQPENVVLLIDTYDVEQAARRVVALARELSAHGIVVKAVRIDSGDLAANARQVRTLFDQSGFHDIGIFASGNLDEFALETLIDGQAPINGFGVGTQLDTSGDSPSLDAVYKLQEYQLTPRRKRSEGKATWPGRKQVFRRHDEPGKMSSDLIGLETEEHLGRPLIQPVMRSGKRIHPPPPISDIRAHAARELASLPDAMKCLTNSETYPVEISDAIRVLADSADARGR